MTTPPNRQFVRNEDIERYYDTQQIFYTLFWSRTALHYGLWYENTKSLTEAVLNTNKFIVEALNIGADDRVLDAGCGVGGTSIYVAEATGATVDGITLSTRQVRIAKRRAAKSSASRSLNFSRENFTRTRFKEETFSKLFGVESVCYAHRKSDFLREAHRVMKPRGVVAIIDLFLAKSELDQEEMEIYHKTIEGWAIPQFSTVPDFCDHLAEAGFGNIRFQELHSEIRNSSRRMYFQKLLWAPFDFVASRIGDGSQNLSAKYQKAFFDRGIGTYGAFVATKL